MPAVDHMVETVAAHGQPALGLSDHGNLSGSLQLYKACKKAGILAFPGSEMYLVENCEDKESKRFHMGLYALSHDGYKNLIQLSSRSHQRERYHRKPRIDLADLSDMAEAGKTQDLVLTTGCYFGLAIQTLINHGQKSAKGVIQRYAGWFPNTYVEIQNHHTKHDDEWTDDLIAEAMWEIAQDLGLPVIVTQDSHYANCEDHAAHDMMKRLTIFNAGDEGEVGFPGDSYHLASGSWVRRHYLATQTLQKIWNGSLDSMADLLDKHKLTLPAIDNYKFQVPKIVKNPNIKLRDICMAKMAEVVNEYSPPSNGWDEYFDRLDIELSVIKDTGFADYFHLMSDACQWCRDEGVLYNARGSANSSLICYLMGITGLDPIEWDLLFERFMTRDRAKPPDIDLDIEDRRRQEFIQYIAKRHKVFQIGTFSRLGVDEEGKGSLVRSYLQYKRKALPPEEFAALYGDSPALMETLATVVPEDAVALQRLADMKVLRQPGVHPAGILLSTGQQKIEDYLPTMLIPSSETTVTQMNMEDCEDAGFVKLDALGLRALSTLSVALELLGYDASGKTLPELCSWIRLDDSKVFALIRRGIKNTGIFTFEGWTQARGCREVGVRSVEDLILVNALYRPATIDAGHDKTYLQNRARPHSVVYLHPILEKNLSKTFGIPVYQEQIMGILRDLGFPSGELNQMLKAIKASNDKVGKAGETFANIESMYLDLANEAGMDDEVADKSWDMIRTFSAYSFGRGHSAAYALLGYYMAYIKVNHSLEFHTALLSTIAGAKKEPLYVTETRRYKVKLLPPDINISGSLWTIDRKHDAIRKGLLSIKGMGEKTVEEIVSNAPYVSIEDLIERNSGRAVTGGAKYIKTGEITGKLKALKENNALASLGWYRE